MNVQAKRIAFLIAMLIVVFWGVPTIFGQEFYRIAIGAIAGWQIGGWVFALGERLFPEKA